ncbi:DUF6686 family protein [Aquimarina pacifica]|uniref:DUF6686 family protein n=1 Tax=Aquimarina pacifica TaxID=1296415 RepID=UPI000472E1BF|nr:DUF6686 family protein [Aquimarina pacifica]
MCKDVKIVSKIKKGQLSKCLTCDLYLLTYNNLLFEFTNEEFISFKNYLLSIELDYWEHHHSNSDLKRKIPIPTLQQNLCLMFSRKEIHDIISLVFYSNYDKSKILRVYEIDYVTYAN